MPWDQETMSLSDVARRRCGGYSSFSVSLIDVAARMAVRRLKLSTFISRIDAWWTILSIAATVMAVSGRTLSRPLTGWFAEIMIERRS
jgi:hypothetical protein